MRNIIYHVWDHFTKDMCIARDRDSILHQRHINQYQQETVEVPIRFIIFVLLLSLQHIPIQNVTLLIYFSENFH